MHVWVPSAAEARTNHDVVSRGVCYMIVGHPVFQVRTHLVLRTESTGLPPRCVTSSRPPPDPPSTSNRTLAHKSAYRRPPPSRPHSHPLELLLLRSPEYTAQRSRHPLCTGLPRLRKTSRGFSLPPWCKLQGHDRTPGMMITTRSTRSRSSAPSPATYAPGATELNGEAASRSYADVVRAPE